MENNLTLLKLKNKLFTLSNIKPICTSQFVLFGERVPNDDFESRSTKDFFL